MIRAAATLLLVLLTGSALQPAPALAQPISPSAAQDGSHDFDFEFGTWKAHLSRRLRPLTGSTTWVEYDGPSVVRQVWNGAANLGEIDLDGPAGHIEGMSLRLYNPQTRQWSVSFANRAAGTLGQAMIGGFKDGRGEFYDQEMFNDRAIFVRFIFSDITPDRLQSGTGVLGRRRQDLGSQLDREVHPLTRISNDVMAGLVPATHDLRDWTCA